MTKFAVWGMAELARPLMLVAVLVFLVGLVLSEVRGSTASDSLWDVLSWLFGSGTLAEDESKLVMGLLLFVGFLGYVLLGLIVWVVSMAAQSVQDDSKTLTWGEVMTGVFWSSNMRRVFTILGLLAAVAVAFWFFLSTPDSPESESAPSGPLPELRFAQLPISYSAVTHLAEDLDSYQDVLRYVTQSVPAGPDVVAALRNRGPGGAHAGGIAVTPVITMIAAGETPVVLATTLRSNQRVRLVTFSGRGITDDPGTLRGKRVGVVLNTVGDIYLDRLLQSGGLARDEVTLVNGRPADLRNLLLNGELDAAVLWDPFVTQAVRLYNAREDKTLGEIEVLLDPALYDLAFNIVTTRDRVAEKREELKKLIAASAAAGQFMQGSPAEAQSRLETWLGLESGDLDHFMGTTSFEVYLDAEQMKQWMKEELMWLQGRRPEIEIPADFSPYVDESLLLEVQAEMAQTP